MMAKQAGLYSQIQVYYNGSHAIEDKKGGSNKGLSLFKDNLQWLRINDTDFDYIDVLTKGNRNVQKNIDKLLINESAFICECKNKRNFSVSQIYDGTCLNASIEDCKNNSTRLLPFKRKISFMDGHFGR